MLACESCQELFHGPCLGILHADENAPPHFRCPRCLALAEVDKAIAETRPHVAALQARGRDLKQAQEEQERREDVLRQQRQAREEAAKVKEEAMAAEAAEALGFNLDDDASETTAAASASASASASGTAASAAAPARASEVAAAAAAIRPPSPTRAPGVLRARAGLSARKENQVVSPDDNDDVDMGVDEHGNDTGGAAAAAANDAPDATPRSSQSGDAEEPDAAGVAAASAAISVRVAPLNAARGPALIPAEAVAWFNTHKPLLMDITTARQVMDSKQVTREAIKAALDAASAAGECAQCCKRHACGLHC